MISIVLRWTIVLLISFQSINVQAQMHISTELRQEFNWSEKAEQWIYATKDENEQAFFHFNEEFTMMKYVTSSITSTYSIKSSEWKEKEKILECDVINDAGKKYFMIVDIVNNNIRFMGLNENSPYMIKHKIKKLWFGE